MGCGVPGLFNGRHDSAGGTTATQFSQLQIIDPALHDQAMALLNQQCVTCHGAASSGYGGFRTVDDFSAMMTLGHVVPGNAQGSLIYQKIENGSMPPGGMAQSDRDLIRRWITDAFAWGESPGSPTDRN